MIFCNVMFSPGMIDMLKYYYSLVIHFLSFYRKL